MKKLVAVLLMLCMACLSVPAMADVSIEGVWKLNRVVAGDQVIDADTLAANRLEMTLEFLEDGTFYDREFAGGIKSEYTGTWSLDGNTISLVPDYGDPSVITLSGEEIVIDTESNNTLYLVRDTGAAAKPVSEAPQAVVPEIISDFDGEYVVTGASIMGMTMSLADLGMDTTVRLTVQDGNGHLVSTYTNGYVWEEDVTTEFQDGKLVTSPITMGAGMGNLTMEITLLSDGRLLAVTTIPYSGTELNVTFILVPADQVEQPAA